MTYKLIPTEYGIEKGKVELEANSIEMVTFIQAVSPECFTIEEVAE